MTVDDLDTPLGQAPLTRRRPPISVSHIILGVLAFFLGAFALWAIVADDPLGGEPVAVARIALQAATASKTSNSSVAAEDSAGLRGRGHGPDSAAPSSSGTVQGGTKTVTIIDGKTGERRDVVIPSASNGAATGNGASDQQKFVEVTARGPIPKIAADGTRPAEAFARPVKPLSGRPDAPRVGLVILGLGVSANATAEAIGRLPGAVTLAFMPYGADVEQLVGRARGAGHEVLLQAPMEPFDYPDNDPGPQTLLISLTPEQNLDRLYWLMSRFQGYVGIASAMGARFMASEQAFAPILREIARRGLIFFDDGSNARSVAGRIAGANNVPFATASMALDSVPTPGEIDRALGRLEMAARERGTAVGVSSALPVSIAHIAKWAKAAEARGLLLVPISAVALKAKQS